MLEKITIAVIGPPDLLEKAQTIYHFLYPHSAVGSGSPYILKNCQLEGFSVDLLAIGEDTSQVELDQFCATHQITELGGAIVCQYDKRIMPDKYEHTSQTLEIHRVLRSIHKQSEKLDDEKYYYSSITVSPKIEPYYKILEHINCVADFHSVLNFSPASDAQSDVSSDLPNRLYKHLQSRIQFYRKSGKLVREFQNPTNERASAAGDLEALVVGLSTGEILGVMAFGFLGMVTGAAVGFFVGAYASGGDPLDILSGIYTGGVAGATFGAVIGGYALGASSAYGAHGFFAEKAARSSERINADSTITLQHV